MRVSITAGERLRRRDDLRGAGPQAEHEDQIAVNRLILVLLQEFLRLLASQVLVGHVDEK